MCIRDSPGCVSGKIGVCWTSFGHGYCIPYVPFHGAGTGAVSYTHLDQCATLCAEGSARTRRLNEMVKLERAQGGCLGTKSR